MNLDPSGVGERFCQFSDFAMLIGQFAGAGGTGEGTDVFFVVFEITNPDSRENVKLKWVPEIKHHCPDVPIILVGLKADLRHHEETRFNNSFQIL